MILPLETFRGIFALIIVLHHLKIDTFIQNSKIIMNGGLVVDFFFVLSGFVISLNYLHKIKTKDQLFLFQKKRFKRLYPLHILTLLIFVSIEFIKLIVNNFTNLESTYEPFGDFNNLYSLVANFFLLHGWYGWSYNLPSWSISTEFYTYFIFGLIILISTNKLRFILSAIFFALIILLLNNFDIKKFDFLIYPARCIYSFFLGVIVYLIYEKFKSHLSYWFSLFLIIGSFAIIILSDQLPYNYKYIFAPIIFGFTILFVSKLNQDSLLYRFLSNKCRFDNDLMSDHMPIGPIPQ